MAKVGTDDPERFIVIPVFLEHLGVFRSVGLGHVGLARIPQVIEHGELELTEMGERPGRLRHECSVCEGTPSVNRS